MDVLLDPPFAKDPPLKLDVPAKTLGLILAILGAIGTVFGLLGLIGVSAFAAVVGGPLPVLGPLISFVGTALGAWGGYQMYQQDVRGKRLVIYGLILNVVGGFVAVLAGSGLGSWIVNAALAFVLYYVVVISRFEDEPRLVGATSPRSPERREGPPAP